MLLCVLLWHMAVEPMTQSWDHRDQAVLDALDEAELEKVSLSDLRTPTGRRRTFGTTTRCGKRIEHLTKEGPFERVKFQVWRFRPD